jgi:hypothetical protein
MTAERVLVVVLAAVVIVALVAWTIRSRRPGGLGPPMKMSPLTRAGRRRVNRTYADHGWAEPFDDDGDLLPARDREPRRR